MKKIFILLLFFIVSKAFAQVEVIVDPMGAVKDEVFDVKFKITTTSNEKPFISFTPYGAEVLEKVSRPEFHYEIRGGLGGRAQTKKTIIYTYKLIAPRSGVATLKDIQVDIGSQKLTHKSVRIKIASKRREMPKIFARAEVSREKAYIGEGIDLRYYVYSRLPIVQTEIKSFPKLNGFIKRFHKTNDSEETVRIDGQIYRRTLRYSARIYPEKEGSLTIDPLRLVVQYAKGTSNPFGSFGFGFRRFSKKNLSSKRVKIEVYPIPSENVPSNFSGLVGEHHFKLTMQKDKYLVNEAIEARLEVTGPGALEKMDAPSLYRSDSLEKFDDKSEFYEVGLSQGRKVFEYTYLARANDHIKKRVMKISYFDPETKKFREKEIIVPKLIIGGSAISGAQNTKKSIPSNGKIKMKKEGRDFKLLSPEIAMSAPLFSTSWKSIPLHWSRNLFYFLLFLIFIQIAEFIHYFFKKKSYNKNIDGIYRDILKRGPSYSQVMGLLFKLSSKDISQNTDKGKRESDIFKVIEKSSLEKSDKEYFKDLIKKLGKGHFGKGGEDVTNKSLLKKSSFKALVAILK